VIERVASCKKVVSADRAKYPLPSAGRKTDEVSGLYQRSGLECKRFFDGFAEIDVCHCCPKELQLSNLPSTGGRVSLLPAETTPWRRDLEAQVEDRGGSPFLFSFRVAIVQIGAILMRAPALSV
jgi:hypothetical protein